MIGHRKFGLLGASGIIAAGSLLVSAVPAFALPSYTATLSACGGGLSILTSTTTVAYPITLGAVNTASTPVPMSFDVGDCTGAGAGWHIAGQQSLAFISAGPHTLQNTTGNAIAINTDGSRPSATCDTGVSNSCALATSGTLTYPGIVFGTSSGNTIYSAVAGTGMGNQTVILNEGIGTILTSNFAGTYTATWVLTLTAGP